MPKRKKRRNSKKNSKKRNTQDALYWVTTGIIQIIFAALAISKIGWLGKQVANLIRLFVGDFYLVAAILLAVFGLVMVIYNQPADLKFKRSCGLILTILGILLLQSGFYFANAEVNNAFMNSFWHEMAAEFGRDNVTVSVGGGLIGALGFQIFYPLLGQIGIRIIAILLLPIGTLMFFDVKYRTIVELFQKFSQRFIAKNKQAGNDLKNKYTELIEKQKEHRASNRQKLTDPLKNDDNTVFPDVADFENDSTSEDPSVTASEPIDSLDSMPEVIAPEPISEATEPKVSSEPTPMDDELPKSHSFADEDKKMVQELADVDHGELKIDNKPSPSYKKPPLSLLDPIKSTDQSTDKQLIQKNTQILQSTFKSFGVKVIIKKAILGPTITRYEVQPAVGVKVSRIVNLADDLALALAAKDIRIEAPIPGKPFIGIEVPNRTTSVVSFKDVMEHQDKKAKKNPMQVPLGKDVSGQTISANLAKMPHLLIAGSTGSGKSVAINTILTSILMKAKPDEVKLVLIDPKMVELSVYNGVPHLLIPVVTDAKLAANALHKVVKEMERRYKLFAASGARNMGEYNQKVAQNNQDKTKPVMDKLPYI